MFYTRVRLLLETMNLIGHGSNNKSRIVVDKKSGTVIKNIKSLCRLEKEVASFLCQQYKEKLGLNFIYSETQDGYKLQMPIMKLAGAKYYQYTPEELFSATAEMLHPLENNPLFFANECKSSLVRYIKIYCRDSKPSNFFIHNGKAYLLDLEDFFFSWYDKNGNILSIDSTAYSSKGKIKEYQMPKTSKPRWRIIKKYMLVY